MARRRFAGAHPSYVHERAEHGSERAILSATSVVKYVRRGLCEDALVSYQNAARFLGQAEHEGYPAGYDRAIRAFVGAEREFKSRCLRRTWTPQPPRVSRKMVKKAHRKTQAYKERVHRARYGRPLRYT